MKSTEEAKRLQTFPDNFIIKGVWGEAMRQIRNAVPIVLAESMGHQLIKTMNSTTFSKKIANNYLLCR